MSDETNKPETPDLKDWSKPNAEGIISVPDELDSLINSIAFQVKLSTISKLFGEAEMICRIGYVAQKFFTKETEMLEKITDRAQTHAEQLLFENTKLKMEAKIIHDELKSLRASEKGMTEMLIDLKEKNANIRAQIQKRANIATGDYQSAFLMALNCIDEQIKKPQP